MGTGKIHITKIREKKKNISTQNSKAVSSRVRYLLQAVIYPVEVKRSRLFPSPTHEDRYQSARVVIFFLTALAGFPAAQSGVEPR